jgi:hypothetical protein
MIILRKRRMDEEGIEDAGWQEETEEDDWPRSRGELAGFLLGCIEDVDYEKEVTLRILIKLAKRLRVRSVIDKIGTPAKQKATKEFIISLLPDFGFTWNGREVVPL